MIAHPEWQIPSTATASTTVATPGRRLPMSQFHLSDYWRMKNCPKWGFKQGQDGMVYLGCPIRNTPTHSYSPGGGTSGEGIIHQPTHPVTYSQPGSHPLPLTRKFKQKVQSLISNHCLITLIKP